MHSIAEYSLFCANMRNAQAGPSIDEGGLDGDSGDMLCARTDHKLSSSVPCASPELIVVEDINE